MPTEHGVVLIFDEVKTGVVLAWGGAYEYFGVQPDLFCLAKSIGGGIPIGAFGGRREVMRVIETLEGSQHHAAWAAPPGGIEHSTAPGGATRVAHLGTFNGNPLSMTAGLVTLTQILVKDAYPRLHALADRLTAGCAEVIDEFELPGYAINVGPEGLRHVHAGARDELPRLHRPRRRAVGGELLLPRQPRHPAAARARTTSGRCRCSTPRPRSSATSRSSASSPPSSPPEHRH